MTSLPVDINYGTPASFRSALASCKLCAAPAALSTLKIHFTPDRRSQYICASFIDEPQRGLRRPSTELDPEACILPNGLHDDGASTPSSSRTVRPEDGLMDNLQWDEDDVMTLSQNRNSYQWDTPTTTPAQLPEVGVPQERTPLIQKANSSPISAKGKGYESIGNKKRTKKRTKLPRRSTFGQTVCENSVRWISYLSTFANSSCSMQSLCFLVLGCYRNPSPSPMPAGVAAPYCSLHMRS